MRSLAVIVALAVMALVVAGCDSAEAPKVKIENGSLTLNQIGETLPGLGTLMPAIGSRYTAAFYAAKAGNWDLVDYELEELAEGLEIGTITRPKRKKTLEAFLNGPFADLTETAKKRSFPEFEAAFNKGAKACNGCHKTNEKPFIFYKLPAAPDGNLDLGHK